VRFFRRIKLLLPQRQKKVTRSVIAPEISVKKARLVELISLAGISDTGVISLEGLAHAEASQIIDEHKAIAAQLRKGVQS
jgi:hypothetical protein